MKGSARK